jgi:S-DNA-T family DNA segregation ATPase FtsK/SpoIIIE
MVLLAMAWDDGCLLLDEATGPLRVPVVFAVGEAELELDLGLAPSATVSELVEALAGGAVDGSTRLFVDGRAVDRDAAVAEAWLRPGSRLSLGVWEAPLRNGVVALPKPVVELRVVGGLDAGGSFALAPGRWLVGRAGADVVLDGPTVSGRHAEVVVDGLGGVVVRDLGSWNGTKVDGSFVVGDVAVAGGSVVSLGAVQIEFGAAIAAGPRPRSMNRPPRPAPPAPPVAIAVPEEPSPPAARSRLAWIAMLAPMAMGVFMAVVWDPRMALFGVFTPVMILGSWAEDRRRSRKDARRATAALAVELERFAEVLDSARADAVARRRALLPDPAEVVARAVGVGTRLWERRPEADDFLRLRVGTAGVPWHPVLAGDGRRHAAGAEAVLAAHSVLEGAPLDVDLRPGCVLGVVGSRAAVEPFLRSLVVQAATLHGPADVRIAVLTDEERARSWSWARWLPHSEGWGEAAGVRLLSASPDDRGPVVNALAAMGPAPVRLLVVDADGLTEGRPAPVRSLLAGAAGPVAGIVVTSTTTRLPAMCTTVIELEGDDGVARTFEPATNRRLDGVLVGGMTLAAATAAARSLAGVDDPEVQEAGHSLPSEVALLSLLPIEAIAERWAQHVLAAPIGVTEQGPLVLDLVADGPHGLLGGTTGSGKSELLRTLVVSLAATADPEHLNFVLVDYKGGSAFDACARLPHTVGLVTDLDEHLGQRALRCLEAELRYRERVLRAAGAADLPGYLRLGLPTPLPRLVVVIDEFATLASELPDFVDALVGIAQRGRSLGVHLLLATQRPAGAVKDNIRANTNLRVALRMQDAADSTDVIDVPAAAAIGRRQAGRGYVRLGPREVVPFQAAMVSGRSGRSPSSPVQLRPIGFGPDTAAFAFAQSDAVAPAGVCESGGGEPTDLERLVDAIEECASRAGFAPPRRPWPEPLPASLPLSSLAPGQFLLADDLVGQCHRPAGWSPREDGNLLLYGLAGSGTTTAVESLVRSLARSFGPEELHVYALDFGAGGLSSLAELAHVGAVIAAAEDERQRRLLRFLRTELDRRRAAASSSPTIVLAIDNWSGFASSFDDDFGGLAVRDEVARLVADGPAVGMSVVITADQEAAVPLAIANLVPAKLLFHLGRGRGLDTRTGLEVQVAFPDADAVPRTGPRTAPPIGVLPREVSLWTL